MSRAAESPFTKRIDRRVLAYVRNRGVIGATETIVVGVSGGPDSTALLLILARLQDELGLRMVVAHFDHMLRSREEADGDRAFVRQLARSLKIEFVAGGGDVRARARRAKESVEEAARYMRYRFLGREALRLGAQAVAVGHTLDDRAETVLQHVIRGAGLDGLAAMPPRAPWPFGRGPEIARPLLELSRADTERYCRESAIEARQDPTNDTLIATRNRVRHELMPVVRSFNPRVAEALARLADAAVEDATHIAVEADALWTIVAVHEPNGVSLGARELSDVPRAIAVRLLRRAISEMSAGESEATSEHLNALLETDGRATRISLPGGLTGIRRGDRVGVYSTPPAAASLIALAPLLNPGITRGGDWTIEVGRQARPHTGAHIVVVNELALDGALTVRSRRPGDRLRPFGLCGSKKVQDILVDAKVPREERDGVPIICDDKGIVWVVGHCIDERVAVRPGARRVLRLRARRSPR